MSGKIATLGDMAVMREDGTETVVIVIGACQGEMLDATTTRGHDGTGIFSKGAMTAAGMVLELREAIAMNSQCKWEDATGRRVLVHHQRRKSLHLT